MRDTAALLFVYCWPSKARSDILSGFLQVRENWNKSGNLCGQGKVRENIIFEKSRK